MAKKLTSDQEAIVSALEVEGRDLAEVRSRAEVAMKAVHARVIQGFRAGISGYKLAKASGMSLPRIYQLRPDKEEDDARQTAQASTSE